MIIIIQCNSTCIDSEVSELVIKPCMLDSEVSEITSISGNAANNPEGTTQEVNDHG